MSKCCNHTFLTCKPCTKKVGDILQYDKTILVVVVVVWQLSCRGSYHFLKRDCVADAVPLYQYTHWKRYSFRRPQKDDRLSQPPGVLIQRPTGLELRTLGSQAATLTTEPTPGLMPTPGLNTRFKNLHVLIYAKHRTWPSIILGKCREQEESKWIQCRAEHWYGLCFTLHRCV